MDTYKLTYFNLRGIVEPVRLMFKYANVPFEDNQVDAYKWNDLKKDFKWQQLPILEYNGKTLTQSGAMTNFLARKFNLTPEDTWDQAKCEEIFGAANDLRLHIKPFFQVKLKGDVDRTEELRTQLLDTTVPLFLKNLNELLEELRKESRNEMDSEFILGGVKPTWADFCLAHFTDQWSIVLEKPDLLDKYPLLKKQQNAVYCLDNIAEWIAKRPQTIV